MHVSGFPAQLGANRHTRILTRYGSLGLYYATRGKRYYGKRWRACYISDIRMRCLRDFITDRVMVEFANPRIK